MLQIEKISQTVLYENPEPNLFSRHGYFPGVVKLNSGKLLCLFVMGQAFESADQTTWIAASTDNGQTWQLQGPVYDKSVLGTTTSDCMKPTLMQDGRLIAIGYRFDRSNPDCKLVNIQTGGLRSAEVIVSFSDDEGGKWSIPKPISLPRSASLEISGPCIQLHNGNLLAGGSPFPLWDGTNPRGNNGVLLQSIDKGQTWNDDVSYFKSKSGTVLPFETRFCQMSDGRIIAIVWAHDTSTGTNLPNQITVSNDCGQTWSAPIDTGILGQASSLIPLEGDYLLTIHAQREGKVGLYVRVVKLSGNKLDILREKNIWDKASSVNIGSYSDMSNSLRFGQPSLTKLSDNEFLAVHWAILDGQGKIMTHHLAVTNRYTIDNM